MNARIDLDVTMPGGRDDTAPRDLPAAVLSTIAYNDLFGFPPGAGEIHRYLHGQAADAGAVAAVIEQLRTDGALISDGRWYALPGREHFFEQRAARNAHARRRWKVARRYAALLATIPTVRMVGVTGSLAVGNPEQGADIDFMLVVDGGTVWRTRTLIKVLELLDHRFGRTLCVNYLLSERALALPDRSLYIAQELAQMVPVYGRESYEALRAQNPWVQDYLPNAGDSPVDVRAVRSLLPLRLLLRPLMLSPPVRWFERRECERKLRRYNDTDFLPGKYSRYRREATGHRLDVRDRVEALHRARLTEGTGRPLRVLFGQSYHLYFDPKLWREMRPYPPLGSLYGAAVAREAGFDVRFFDAMLATGHASWALSLDRHRPDVVVLYEDNFNYLTKMCLLRMRDAAVAMIAAARRIGARVVVSGSDASDNVGVYLDAGAEFVIRGEGEKALEALLAAIERGANDFGSVAGVSYRGADGAIVDNAAMPIMRRLDELPLPAWDLVELDRYRAIWRRRHGRFSINLVTTRGCPYHCNWCAKPIWGQHYASRSPEHVVEELQQLMRTVEPDHVWFMDDIFGLKPGWVKKFADCLERRGIRIRFKCLTRPDLLRRPGEVEALAAAGCEVVWIGAESGSQRILDAMEKGTSVSDIERMTRRLKEHGIRVGHFIQFGYPGETFADIRATLSMIRRLLPDELGISVSYPLPGTPFYERVRTELGRTRNWRDSSDLAMLFRGPFGTSFYRSLHRHTHRYLAWHRTLAELRDRSLFRQPFTRRARRLLRFGFATLLLPPGWLALRLRARFSAGGLEALPTALDRQAAARPSDQEAI